MAKCRAADVTVDRAGAVELRVVESIKCFHAEEQGLRFDELQLLGQRDVVVILARTVKKRRFELPGVPSTFMLKSAVLK